MHAAFASPFLLLWHRRTNKVNRPSLGPFSKPTFELATRPAASVCVHVCAYVPVPVPHQPLHESRVAFLHTHTHALTFFCIQSAPRCLAHETELKTSERNLRIWWDNNRAVGGFVRFNLTHLLNYGASGQRECVETQQPRCKPRWKQKSSLPEGPSARYWISKSSKSAA